MDFGFRTQVDNVYSWAVKCEETAFGAANADETAYCSPTPVVESGRYKDDKAHPATSKSEFLSNFHFMVKHETD